MSSRIEWMTGMLRQKLEKETLQDWSHIEKQIGMFSYTGLTAQQVGRLSKGVPCWMSVCGLNEDNIDRVVCAIGEAIKASSSNLGRGWDR
ncbi:hypothetical protein N7524_011320 [Penicillium chrysogenum]|nr:hypothetical protein N7524_011320 [Penicillium chrysogenum]